jgi:hypothetical protein
VADLVGQREAAAGRRVGGVQVHLPLRGIEEARDAVKVSLLDGQAGEILGDRLDRDGRSSPPNVAR